MIVGGIFVGGASRRMGGRPKGLLPGPGGAPLVERARRVLAEVCDHVVLVGRHPAYATLAIEALADDPPGVGPLGGLAALLGRAGRGGRAVALACDMPRVDATDLRALLEVGGTAAPRRDGRWEPLCAVYRGDAIDEVRARIARDERRLQGLLDALRPSVVALPDDHLVDWDTPEDVSAS